MLIKLKHFPWMFIIIVGINLRLTLLNIKASILFQKYFRIRAEISNYLKNIFYCFILVNIQRLPVDYKILNKSS